MNTVRLIIFGFICIGWPALAATRTSLNYSLATEALDAGGEASTSTSYTARSALGSIAGTATKASPSETSKHGYIAQLADTQSVTVSAASTTFNETTTTQLSATQTLDDATTTSLLASEVAWLIVSGPIASISSSGLATAGATYVTTAASVTGSYQSITSNILALSIVEAIADNYGTYASDGLPDDWQVQYFGIGNPNAAPLLDPDGDGFTNLFEYDASLSPISASIRFALQLQAVSGQPTQQKIIFTPRYATSTYTVQSSPDLITWSSLTSSTTSDVGQTRTVTDNAASGERKFYRVSINRP